MYSSFSLGSTNNRRIAWTENCKIYTKILFDTKTHFVEFDFLLIYVVYVV